MCHTLFCQALPNVNSVNPHNPYDKGTSIIPFLTDLKTGGTKGSVIQLSDREFGVRTQAIWRQGTFLHAKVHSATSRYSQSVQIAFIL